MRKETHTPKRKAEDDIEDPKKTQKILKLMKDL